MTRALVIGAGVAGPVAAMALQLAGTEATVHEASPGVAAGASGWSVLATNGMDALRAIGADAAMADVGSSSPSVRALGGRGAVLGTSPSGAPRPGASGSRVLLRSDLHRVLHEEARRRGVRVRYGSRLVQAGSTPDGVAATFADGSTERADLLVGADGVHSVVRRALDPASDPLRPARVLTIAGRSQHVPPGATVGELVLVFGARALFGYAVAPDGRTWWCANPPVRVAPTLGGDAVHASTPGAGQGASMAAEDAVVLAQCPRDLPVAEALARFERLRRRRVERVVALAARTCAPAERSAGSLAAQEPWTPPRPRRPPDRRGRGELDPRLRRG